MNRKTVTFMVAIFLLAFVSLGNSGGCGGTAPSPPIVPPQPEPEPEPPSALGNVTLQWHPHPDPAVIGYRVYYGQSSRDYLYYDSVGLVTIYTVEDLIKEVRWYFTITAYGSEGEVEESEYSNEVSCVIQGG